MSWFSDLTGFEEKSAKNVQENLILNGETLTSKVNNRKLICGTLETLSLGYLRSRVSKSNAKKGILTVNEVVANAQNLHVDESNAGALFQVASQFNLLEMISPSVTPENGISGYEFDHTQGPVCAIACGAGTIYRNYLVPIEDQIGQTKNKQIDCLNDLGKALGNDDGHLWDMQNGYALPDDDDGLIEISEILNSSTESEIDEYRKLLQIGVQWNTQVTLDECKHTVTQVYGSALPVAYSTLNTTHWKPFAKLVLEASYEATICAGILNAASTGNNNIYLTLLGGGAFGNPENWILDAISRSLNLYEDYSLNISIVSYGSSNPSVKKLIEK